MSEKDIFIHGIFIAILAGLISFVITFFLLPDWIIGNDFTKIMISLGLTFWISAGVIFYLYDTFIYDHTTSTRDTPSIDSPDNRLEVKTAAWGKYDSNKPLYVNVETAIRSFRPRKLWQYERQYQDELYDWLKQDFPYIVGYEVQTGSSRPDLVIKDIAIEIKGPTGNRELDTLTTKFLKYSNYYPHFFIVLFDCKFSERHFYEIERGVRNHFPNVKIIRK